MRPTNHAAHTRARRAKMLQREEEGGNITSPKSAAEKARIEYVPYVLTYLFDFCDVS